MPTAEATVVDKREAHEALLSQRHEIASKAPRWLSEHAEQIIQLKVDMSKALGLTELVLASIEGPASLMNDRAATALMRKVLMHVQLGLCLGGSHPGGSVKKPDGRHIEIPRSVVDAADISKADPYFGRPPGTDAVDSELF